MRIYNLLKAPEGLSYDEIDYEAVYQSGYTAGFDSGVTDGYNEYECEEIVVPYSLDFKLRDSYTLPLNIHYSGKWSITYASTSYPDNMVTLSQTEGTGNTEVLVTIVGDLPCTGFPTIFGQLIVSDTFGRLRGVALSYTTCHSTQTPYVEKITITSISGAKIPPQTPVEWARDEHYLSNYPAPIALNWPSTGGSFTYDIQMHLQDAEWWDSYGNRGTGNTSGLTVTVPAWSEGDTELRSYGIGFYNNCCRTYSGSAAFVSGSIDEPEVPSATALTFGIYRPCDDSYSESTVLYRGMSAITQTIVSPSGAASNLVYTSSNPTVATIDANGIITVTDSGFPVWEEIVFTVTDTVSNISASTTGFCTSVPTVWAHGSNDCPCGGLDCSCIPATGGTFNFNGYHFICPDIYISTEWAIVSKPEWVTVSPSSGNMMCGGSGLIDLTVTVAANNSSSLRGGEIVLKENGPDEHQMAIMIEQEGLPQ